MSNRPGPGVGAEFMTCRYSMVIQWSDEDQVYVVTLPEFGGSKTPGDTFEDAARNGREVLELLMETYEAEGWPLPEPALLGSTIPTVQSAIGGAT